MPTCFVRRPHSIRLVSFPASLLVPGLVAPLRLEASPRFEGWRIEDRRIQQEGHIAI